MLNTSALNLSVPVDYSYAGYDINMLSDDSADNFFAASSDTLNSGYSTDSLSDDDIELVKEELERKVDELKQELENSQNTRGKVTTVINNVKSTFGGGDKSKENKISEYEELLEGLEENPENILQVYETIMGEELTAESLVALQTSENIVNNLDEEEQEAIVIQLENQLAELESEFETAQNSNGWISGKWSKFKNWSGIGASSNKTSAEIKTLKEQIESLKNGEADLATVYKNITGEELTTDSLDSFLNGEITLSDISKAGESLNNYEEGQQMTVDTVADITSGIISVGTVAACSAVGICAAPFTAGASLGMISVGLGIAAGTGAAVKVAIKASDCIGNEKTYSLTDAGYDVLTGATNGAMGVFSNGVGSTVGKGIMKAAGMEALETTAKRTFTQSAIKVATSAADMAIDGALSGMTDSATRDIGENIFYGEDHTINEIVSDSATGFVGGLIASPVIGGGMKGAGILGSKLGSEFADSSLGRITNEISEALSDTVLGQAAKETKETLNEKFYKFASDVSDTKATNLLNLWGKVEIGDELVDADFVAKLIDGVDIDAQESVLFSFANLRAAGMDIGDEIIDSSKLTSGLVSEPSDSTLIRTTKISEKVAAIKNLSEKGIDINEENFICAISMIKADVDITESNFKYALQLEKASITIDNASLEQAANLCRSGIEINTENMVAALDKDAVYKTAEKLGLDISSDDFFSNKSYQTYAKMEYLGKNFADADNMDTKAMEKLLKGFDTVDDLSKANISGWLSVKDKLWEYSETINKTGASNITSKKAEIAEIFSDNEVLGREKGTTSIYDKLSSKVLNGKISADNLDYNKALEGIGDLYGTRVILNDASQEETEQVFNKLVQAIQDDKLTITEIHNYHGLDAEPYFSSEQLKTLRDVCEDKGIYLKVDNSVSQSGYISTQMNIAYEDGTSGELQIRTSLLNTYGDIEHIPYDIGRGKDLSRGIEELGELYEPLQEMVEMLDREGLTSEYNQYILECYQYMRNYEIATLDNPSLEFILPEFPESLDGYESLSFESLKNIHDSAEIIKSKYNN